MHPILRSLCLPLSESQRLARLHYRALALRAMLVATPFALSAWLHLASHYQILLLPPHWLESGRLFLPSLDRTMRFWEYMADYQHAPRPAPGRRQQWRNGAVGLGRPTCLASFR